MINTEIGIDKYPFKFSVVIAVYNVGPFLRETIDSVLCQDIGFRENVQLILVDDGSKDDSGSICDEYQEQYPDNIIVIHKKNGGVSSARNEGIKRAEGEYINFLDGDDRFSEEVLSSVYEHFKLWEDEVDLVTIPLVFFDGKTGEHLLNTKFSQGSRVIHVKQIFDQPLLFINASFIKNSVIKKFSFDQRLSQAEDAKMVMQILLNNMCYGVVKEATYWYRKRSSGELSALQQSRKKITWYTNYMQYFALWAMEYCMETYQYIPKFVQYTVMHDLKWRFLDKELDYDLLKKEGVLEYFNRLHDVLNYIDDEIILKQKYIYSEHKTFILKIKYGTSPSKEIRKNDILYYYKNANLCCEANFMTCLEFFGFKDGLFSLEGYMITLEGVDTKEFKIFVSENGVMHECELVERNITSYSMGKEIARGVGFRIALSPDRKRATEIKFFCQVDGNLVERKSLTFRKFSPLQNAMWNSYYVADPFILTYAYNALYLHPYSLKMHVRRELSFLKGLCLQKNVAAYKAILLRIAHHVGKLLPKKETWLISDRVEKADDNGEALFRYMNEHKDPKIKTIFAISPNCDDFSRLKKYGKVIPFGGWQYKWHYLFGAKIISSQGEDYIFRPLMEFSKYYGDLIQKSKFIFLQHGIIQNDLSRWLNRYNKNIYLFMTSTRAEWNSILNYGYFYSEKEVKLTGLPRHDLLYHDEKRYITIVPSWRSYLLGPVDPKTGKHAVNPGFEQSTYYRMYSGLLSNCKLVEAARKYHYTIRFLSHPIMADTISYLTIDPSIEVLTNGEEPYRKIFAESDLLVTDYSSVAFDFAYLRKPILYYQEDKAEIFSGHHTFDRGYFEYEKDGFGEVEYTVNGIVDRMVEYMENDCVLKEKYRERINHTFQFNDQSNCKRVYETIKFSDKKS